VCCHRLAVTAAGNNGLSSNTLVDGRYTYQEVRLSHTHTRARNISEELRQDADTFQIFAEPPAFNLPHHINVYKWPI
jgi:hypothetical protein